MAQTLFTGQTPAVAGTDGAPGITTATTIRSTVDGVATKIRFYTGPTVGGTYTGLLWQRTANDTGAGGGGGGGTGAGTLLASKVFSGTPAVSSWNEIVLDTPIPIIAGITYRVGIHNPSRYVATNSFFVSPLVNGDLVADEDGETTAHLGLIRQGTFIINALPAYPTQVGSSASYFVDFEFEPDSEDPAEGSASVTIDLAPAATGARASRAAAALGLSLAVAAAGSSPHGGSAALTINLAVAAAGQRAAQGSAGLGLSLAVVMSGGRESNGAAALTLNLAVSAIGSNGDVGCPVPAFPFSPSPISGYLWTPRPVMSFPGGECT